MSVGEPERVLLSLGPLGVSVCEGPYGIFRWHRRNVILIELTEDRLRGTKSRGVLRLLGKSRRDGVEFEVPYTAITSVTLRPHPARLGLQKVLEVTYREGGERKQLSLAAFNGPAEAAFAVLRSRTAAR